MTSKPPLPLTHYGGRLERTMPTRMLRDGILLSSRINKVGMLAELHFRRLMSVVDDYGRFEGDPEVVRAATWAMRREITSEMVTGWHKELSAGDRPLVLCYEDENKKYIEIQQFGQRNRTDKYGKKAPSRFPAPSDEVRRNAAECGEQPPCAAERGGLQPVRGAWGVGRGAETGLAAVSSQPTDPIDSLLQPPIQNRDRPTPAKFEANCARFEEEFWREVSEQDVKNFISQIRTIEDESLFFATLAARMGNPEFNGKYEGTTEKYLTSGMWRKMPKIVKKPHDPNRAYTAEELYSTKRWD